MPKSLTQHASFHQGIKDYYFLQAFNQKYREFVNSILHRVTGFAIKKRRETPLLSKLTGFWWTTVTLFLKFTLNKGNFSYFFVHSNSHWFLSSVAHRKGLKSRNFVRKSWISRHRVCFHRQSQNISLIYSQWKNWLANLKFCSFWYNTIPSGTTTKWTKMAHWCSLEKSDQGNGNREALPLMKWKTRSRNLLVHKSKNSKLDVKAWALSSWRWTDVVTAFQIDPKFFASDKYYYSWLFLLGGPREIIG